MHRKGNNATVSPNHYRRRDYLVGHWRVYPVTQLFDLGGTGASSYSRNFIFASRNFRQKIAQQNLGGFVLSVK